MMHNQFHFCPCPGAPQIPEGIPDSFDVVEFNPLILPCPAEGTPRPQITWFKNGQPVTGKELGLALLDDGSLEITSAQAGDSGDYRCQAENIAGVAGLEVNVKVLSKLLLLLIPVFG